MLSQGTLKKGGRPGNQGGTETRPPGGGLQAEQAPARSHVTSPFPDTWLLHLFAAGLCVQRSAQGRRQWPHRTSPPPPSGHCGKTWSSSAESLHDGISDQTSFSLPLAGCLSSGVGGGDFTSIFCGLLTDSSAVVHPEQKSELLFPRFPC